MHPRLSVSAVCSYRQSLDDDLALWERLGVRRVGLTLAKLETAGFDAAAKRIADAGLDVNNVIAFGPRLSDPTSWSAHADRLLGGIDAARAIGADLFVLTTGPAGQLTWEEAADRLAEFLPTIQTTDFPLIIEHTNALRVDVGFVHTLRDMVDLARRLYVGVLCEVNACWSERGLAATVHDGVDVIKLVQVSDFVVGTHDTPNRVVPGDGDIPLLRVLNDIVTAGYRGTFDLELIGPRVEDEGYESAIRRAVDATSRLLESVSA
ncbi:MAG: sugar phosphate isomerase/epimerase family protein [Actinomycetes bacterium]